MKAFGAFIVGVLSLLMPSLSEGATVAMPQGWAGFSNSKDDGTFNGCSAATTFNSGVSVYFFVYPNYALDLAFQNPVWNGQPSEKIVVASK